VHDCTGKAVLNESAAYAKSGSFDSAEVRFAQDDRSFVNRDLRIRTLAPIPYSYSLVKKVLPPAVVPRPSMRMIWRLVWSEKGGDRA